MSDQQNKQKPTAIVERSESLCGAATSVGCRSQLRKVQSGSIKQARHPGCENRGKAGPPEAVQMLYSLQKLPVEDVVIGAYKSNPTAVGVTVAAPRITHRLNLATHVCHPRLQAGGYLFHGRPLFPNHQESPVGLESLVFPRHRREKHPGLLAPESSRLLLSAGRQMVPVRFSVLKRWPPGHTA